MENFGFTCDVCGNIQNLYHYNKEIFVRTKYCGVLTKENYLEACELCRKLFSGRKYE